MVQLGVEDKTPGSSTRVRSIDTAPSTARLPSQLDPHGEVLDILIYGREEVSHIIEVGMMKGLVVAIHFYVISPNG